MQDLMEAQIALEQLTYDESIARQRAELEKASKRKEADATKSGRYYVRSLSKAMVPALSVFLSPEKRRGRHQAGARCLKDTGLEVEVIAYLAVKGLIALLHNPGKTSIKRLTLCGAMADRVHDEWRMRVFSDTKERKKLLKTLFKDFDKRTYPKEWRKRTIRNYFDAEQVNWQGWTEREKHAIGYVLLTIFENATADTFGEGKPFVQAEDKGIRYSLSEDAVKHIGELQTYQVPLFTLCQPMVVKPKPWTEDSLFRGGYISKRVRRYPIIKGAKARDATRFADMDWSAILPAVNAIQETPWRINGVMLEALDWAYNSLSKWEPFKQRGIGKMVSCEKQDLPEAPEGYGVVEEITKQHNKACFLIHSRNREDKSKRIAVEMALMFAKRYQDYAAIYFPHNMDSRGRVYPLPAVLNPQGPDFIKGLLEFSQGEPIETEEQSFWLAVAGANAYGKDKISLEERVQWVNDNEGMITSVAADYRSDLSWTEASEPFGFLRFCLEWTAFRENGFGYLSHMVCPVDATCSGLQHYGAMLRDEVGGKSVNLVPGMSRQDIYGDVASVVIRRLIEEGTPEALAWVAFGIDRKVTKRQVMVVPYAGKFSSCLTYTKEAVAEKLKEGHACPWDLNNEEDHNARQIMLAKHIWEAITEVVVKGREAMKWLSDFAKEYAYTANGTYVEDPYERRMTWKTPDGFEVLHYREDQDRYELQLYFEGKVKLVTYEYNGRLNVGDMSLAVAPNFVHALDATLLRVTVMKAKAVGINHFGMIHDSFGVHARYMDQFLRECVKPAFVEMYEQNDVLAQFQDQFASVVPGFRPPPEKGKLDLQGVLQSEFFFS